MDPGQTHALRFEKLILNSRYESVRDSLIKKGPLWVEFLEVFTSRLIGIGPDSAADFQKNLEGYLSDPGIVQISKSLLSIDEEINKNLMILESGLRLQEKLIPQWKTPHLVTFIGGFDQKFAAIDGIMAVGLENYLGDTSRIYDQLGIPEYIQRHMNPDNLPADGLRAWIYTELPPVPDGARFLDQMVFQGKAYYIISKLMPNLDEEKLFHYTREQLEWCRSHEEAMWRFIAEQNILFSTDRFQVRRFFDEAPFTRDFGNESPGMTGAWIGYRLISKYMRVTGQTLEQLISETDSRKILSQSNYHP
jgi:hypothetical protein